MPAGSTSSAAPAASAAPGGIVVAVALDPREPGGPRAAELERALAAGLDGRPVTVLVPAALPEIALVAPGDPRASGRSVPAADLAAGGVAGRHSPLGALLSEAARREAAAVALVSGAEREGGAGWLRELLDPILDGGFEFVCPTYRRGRFEGLLGTAILYPLTRALYGVRLRQPAGAEAALSLGLARDLLASADWRRDPARAGSDAWLVAEVLAGRRRACQVWLAEWPGDAGAPEEASHALARIVGPVFREMELRADRWQRVEGSEPAPSFGPPGPLGDGPDGVDVGGLAGRFRLGLRELDDLWGLVLPPAARLALRRAAAAPDQALRLDDALWARVVYDFAVAWYARTVERQQLLRSMTPLYLGWLAGFANDVRSLDAAATEARVEALAAAFEREKRYLIGRWRWPDGFNP